MHTFTHSGVKNYNAAATVTTDELKKCYKRPLSRSCFRQPVASYLITLFQWKEKYRVIVISICYMASGQQAHEACSDPSAISGANTSGSNIGASYWNHPSMHPKFE